MISLALLTWVGVGLWGLILGNHSSSWLDHVACLSYLLSSYFDIRGHLRVSCAAVLKNFILK